MNGRLAWLRRISLAGAVLLGAALWDAAALARDLQVTAASLKWVVFFAALGLAFLAAIALAWTAQRPAAAGLLARLDGPLKRLEHTGWALQVVFAALAFLLPALVLLPLPHTLVQLMELFTWRALLFSAAALAGAACLQVRQPGAPFGGRLAAAALLYGVVYRSAAFLPEISTNWFSLGWSEGSRYYYASLYLSRSIYGIDVPPGVLHPTRYLMQAVPFLIDGLPLWFHRLWQVLLWVGVNAWAAWLLARRMLRGRQAVGAARALLAAWAFLFFFQGPIWYHLVVMIAIVLWGFDARRTGRTLLVVAAASVWAGMSRVNWIPFPAALAALLYLLETPWEGRPLVKYLAPPFLWGVAGGLAGLVSQWGYAVLSGNALDQFGSSFTSDLLWYRLFPSATYPLGVIPGILLASIPVLWLVRDRWAALEPIRRLGLAGLLLVFFAGGLVVSAKIGGGSNLHNLDGYIALLAVLAAFLYVSPGGRSHPLALALAIAVPVGFAVATGAPAVRHDPQTVAAELATLTRLAEESAAQGGDVLFIAERQMLAFDPPAGVGLVPEYEKVFLMEMAMAGHAEYLAQFARDLEAHRFALIVADTVNLNLQSQADEFGEENNAWDRAVSYPLLCYYEAVATLEAAGVQVLAPKDSPACPPLMPEE